MLSSLTIKEFADGMACYEPPPGGGSTAALSGLLGVSLVEMIVNCTMKNCKSAEQREFLQNKKKRLAELHGVIEELIDKDAFALKELLEVFHLPDGCQEELSLREAAIQAAVKQAAEVPLETARACLEVLEIAKALFQYADIQIAGDLLVGVYAAYTGAKGALLCTAMNLPLISCKTTANALRGQLILIRSAADELLKMMENRIYKDSVYTVMRA